jgi:hypothetical protein
MVGQHASADLAAAIDTVWPAESHSAATRAKRTAALRLLQPPHWALVGMLTAQHKQQVPHAFAPVLLYQAQHSCSRGKSYNMPHHVSDLSKTQQVGCPSSVSLEHADKPRRMHTCVTEPHHPSSLAHLILFACSSLWWSPVCTSSWVTWQTSASPSSCGTCSWRTGERTTVNQSIHTCWCLCS